MPGEIGTDRRRAVIVDHEQFPLIRNERLFPQGFDRASKVVWPRIVRTDGDAKSGLAHGRGGRASRRRSRFLMWPSHGRTVFKYRRRVIFASTFIASR